jgi:UDP-N-acetylmuramoylalanine--D-glutamate ligase
VAFFLPELLKPLLDQPAAVFGGGVSGHAVLSLLKKVGAGGELFDQKQAGARPLFNAADARQFRLVVFSPGFPVDHPWLRTARAAGCTCLGELDFAGLFWRGTVIAITGTNGKTTLTEFMTHALKHVGRDARAAGNVGFPLSQLVADTDGGVFDQVAVCEISSFQAETLVHFRADSALWTNLAEDHLERHPGMRSYFEAKWRLFDRTVGGMMFAGSSVQRFAAEFGYVLPVEAVVPTEEQPADVLLAGTVFDHYPQRENFLMAAAWWRRAGLAEADLYAAAHSFQLGRHRLAKVATLDGVTFWNDSKGTNFHAVEGALSYFTAPVLLILGGKSKGGDISAFIERIASRTKFAFLIGETGEALRQACERHEVPHSGCNSLAEAVQRAAQTAVSGDHILLSPGFSSFDQFRNYEDRGNQFELLVNHLGTARVVAPNP